MQLDKKQVQRQFDRSAARYDGVAHMQRDIVDALLAQSGLFDGVEPRKGHHGIKNNQAKVILDAGCGTGYALKKISENNLSAKLHAVDLAPNMLAQASKTCPQAVYLASDIESLPYNSESFDAIISSSAIQWCDAPTVIDEFQRCLRPGAKLMLSTFTKGTLETWRSLWGRANQQRFLSVDQFAGLFEQSIWSEQRVITQNFEQKFFSFSEAVASIRDLGAGDASINRSESPMTREQLAFIRHRIEHIIEQQGHISLVYRVAFMHAHKQF